MVSNDPFIADRFSFNTTEVPIPNLGRPDNQTDSRSRPKKTNHEFYGPVNLILAHDDQTSSMNTVCYGPANVFSLNSSMEGLTHRGSNSERDVREESGELTTFHYVGIVQ